MKALKNERGLTLVEVLAALVILGIMFVGVMTIFPQMTLFNTKTEAKLDTMNLARQEVATIVEADKWLGTRDIVDPSLYETFQYKLPIEVTKIPSETDPKRYVEDTSIPSSSHFKRFVRTDGYKYVADIYLNCEPFLAAATSGTIACEDPTLTQLYKVHLKIYKDNQLSSETYSYIKFKVEKQGG